MTETGKFYNFENYAVNLLNKLNKSRISKSESCNVIIIVEDVEFYADKAILSASSEFFRTMFTTNMKEKYEDKVVLKEVSSDVFFHVLNFMYSGGILLSIDNISDYLHAASMMQIKDLLNMISRFFVDDLTEKNCLQLRDIARKYSIEDLVKETTNCIIDNFHDISQQKEFKDLSFEDINLFIFSDDLMAESEENVYNTIINWIKFDTSRVQYLSQLFDHVRLKFISSKCLINSIMRESMVDDNKHCRDLIIEALKQHLKPYSEWICEKRKGYGDRKYWNSLLFNDLLTMTSTDSQLIQFLNNETKKKSSVQMYQNWNITHYMCEVVLYKNALVICGINNIQVVKYDGEWSLLPNLSKQRHPCLALTYKNELLVFGSTVPQNHQYRRGCAVNQQASIDKLNETDTAWITFSNMNARANMKAIYVGASHSASNSHLAFNYHYNPQVINITNDVSSFNLETKVERKLAPMNEARTNFLLAYADAKIYVVGGTGANSQPVTNQMEFLTIKDNVWTNLTFPLPIDGLVFDIIGDQNDILILIKTGNILRYCPQNKKIWGNTDFATGQQLTYGKFLKGGHDLLELI